MPESWIRFALQLGNVPVPGVWLFHSQVRPRFIAAPALRASLARCVGKSSVQTRRRYVQLSTRPSTAVPRRSLCQCPTSQHGSIFDPLLGVSWWFRDAVSAHSVHGPSLWPAHRFGTLYETAWEIRILAGTASDVCWKRIYLHCIAYQRLFRTIRSTYWLTDWLTGLCVGGLREEVNYFTGAASTVDWRVANDFERPIKKNLGRWRFLVALHCGLCSSRESHGPLR